MAGLYPLLFEPRFKERVWGGRTLAALYGKQLPAGVPVGESWEVSDRPGDESVITNGPLAGKTLRWLMEQHAPEVLGDASPADGGRFPLLCKILDARQTLSLQVHPPAHAQHLGEPKTEMWYIAAADPGAELLVGLKRGVDRAAFERAITAGRVADCFHHIPVKAGDAMFLPSGRVHAIGAGLVIFEIQQNSDTTFRVYDWDRVGLDGKPRALHLEESLRSIDFADIEPTLVNGESRRSDGLTTRQLVRDPLFTVDQVRADSDRLFDATSAHVRVIAVVHGRLTVMGGGLTQDIHAGNFCLVPGGAADVSVVAHADASFLVAAPGGPNSDPGRDA